MRKSRSRKATRNIPTLPFGDFLRFEGMAEFVSALAEQRPDLVRLSSLGKSREGRDIYLLTVTDFSTGEAEDKPAYLIQANIHAGELSGTHAALYTARQLVADHGKSDLLKRVAFYIVPRINPDGAEFVVTTSGSIRSRTDRSEREPNTLYQEDIDGDGLIMRMRWEHPDGRLMPDPKDLRLLIQRTKDGKGPFYRSLPEGLIHDWDGGDNIRVEGRSFDWNRNWSYDWRPEPEQSGAGDFPFSEPEMRALATFLHSRPNIFGLLGYHTGPAAVLRPPSTGSDDDLDPRDLKFLKELADIGSKHTGFPMIPVVKYHGADSPDVNLRGHFHNFGYHHLGLFVFEFELGTMFNTAGVSTEEYVATKSTQEREAKMRQVMKWWDRQKRRPPLFRPWKRFRHPQLGEVEIGGIMSKYLANRTIADLRKVCAGTYQFTLEHAGRHPWVILEDVQADAMGGNIYRVRGRVANRGTFPTHITNKGKGLRRLRPVRVELKIPKGVKLLSSQGHRELGHLEGLIGSQTVEWFLSAPESAKHLCEIRVLGGTGGDSSVQVAKPKA